MISGTVVAQQGPVVPLVLHDASGSEHRFDALIDTGFTGWLTLPKGAIAALKLSYCEQVRGVLADGGSAIFNTFYATVIWDGQPRAVFVDELESDPLMGMRLLHGFRFVMETYDDGPVRIEPL